MKLSSLMVIASTFPPLGILAFAFSNPARVGRILHSKKEPAFPAVMNPANNPTSRAKVELGRMLFYDPIISNNNSISCAHCHHPDLGFSDGLPRSLGYGGEGAGNKRTGGELLPRRTSGLWNVAFNKFQYWDGRAKDLEEQARFPITERKEMKSEPETVIAKLNSIDTYPPLFDKAFGGHVGSSVTFDNVLKAIASFERTLISKNSRYDQFKAGHTAALSQSEIRGLKLFSSVKTHCSECHSPPLFTNNEFKVTGVSDVTGLPPDPHKEKAAHGRGGGPNSAYKVPTLRNAALKPPYMHNGSLKSLSDVVQFYSNGGGRGRGLDLPNQDSVITKLNLSGQDKSDLISFLWSLTDTSALPAIPKEVPSGLPVVHRISSINKQ